MAPFNGSALFEDGLGQATGVLLVGTLSLGILRALFAPVPTTRACAVAAGLGLVYLSSLLDAWARSSAARAASALAQGLSKTRFELPWVALLLAVALGALGGLQFLATGRLLQAVGEPKARIISLCVVVLYAALLLRALIAYSSGSASLFVTSVE